MIDTGSMWEGLVPLLTALVPPRSVYLTGDLETIKWRNFVQSTHTVYLEFLLRTPVQKVTQVRYINHCAHGEISVPGSSHFGAEKSWSGRRVQSRTMAGDGSDQRALQYEQTLVSFWTLFAGHCAAFSRTLKPDCVEKPAALTQPAFTWCATGSCRSVIEFNAMMQK